MDVNSSDTVELNKALQKLSLHIQNSPLAVIDWDKNFCVTGWNPAAERIFGYSAEEAIGQHASFIIPKDLHKHVDLVWSELLKNQGGTRSTNENLTKDRKTISCEWYNTPIIDTDGNVVAVTSLVQDVSELVHYIKSLEYQAYHDSLTKLYNRVWLTEYIESTIQKNPNKTFFLFFVDLDQFKEINDTLGHNVGDSMLITLSERLNESMQRRDCKVARLGGDEFVVLSDNLDIKKVVNIIIQDLEAPVDVLGMKLEVGASIGIACYPLHGKDSASLMRCADVAMYHAKETKNHYKEYSKEIDKHSPEHLMLMNELRNAISEEQLILHFQPKIDVRRKIHIGYEALLRWNHPQRGLIPPAAFIPYAEVTDLIRPLTLWVIEHAMIQCLQWSKRGFIHNVSINLSMRNLMDDSMPDKLAILLGKYRVEPSSIELEITESAIMTEPEKALHNIKRLNKLGLLISIDDFGTGYTSLSYLRQTPIHKLKIDKTFVLEMDAKHEDRVIVESIINLAHNLGLKVVAEGVENEAVLALLYDLGCDEAQGYYISHPLAVGKLEKWIFKDKN